VSVALVVLDLAALFTAKPVDFALAMLALLYLVCYAHLVVEVCKIVAWLFRHWR